MKRENGQEQSKAILARLEEQSEKGFGAPKTGQEEKLDWTERWGRRLGVILGFCLALYLLWHLVTTYGP
ncbi:MAG TPA: hypothetical protein VIB38_10335 [Aestuariivirgaceae bacterium]|jgi:hypothetical protein